MHLKVQWNQTDLTLTHSHHKKPRFDKRTAIDVKTQSQGGLFLFVVLGWGTPACVSVCMI